MASIYTPGMESRQGLRHHIAVIPGVFRATGVFIVSALSIWILVFSIERMASPNEATRLDGLSVFIPEGTPRMPVTPSGYGYPHYWRGANFARIQGDIDDALAGLEEPTLFVRRARRRLMPRLDETPLSFISPAPDMEAFATFRPHLIDLGVGLEGGTLTLDLEARDTQPFLAHSYVGERDVLRRAYQYRLFFGVNNMGLAAAVAFTMALVSFGLALGNRHRGMAISFGFVMLCWAVIDLWYTGVFSARSPTTLRVIYSGAIFSLIVASMAFANEWTFRSRFVRRYVVPGLGVAFVAKLLPIFFVSGHIWTYIVLSADAISAACVIFIWVQMFRYIARHPEASLVSATVFIMTTFAVCVDITLSISPAISYRVWPDQGISLHYGPIMSTVLGLTIIGAFARSYIQSERELAGVNAGLSTALAAKEMEIERFYAGRAEAAREAALIEERKRIMRDMHDGVGGRLLSLSLRARQDNFDPEDMTVELEHSLQELRLIIDSMDTADGELDMALGALRGRIEPLLRDAGLDLDWRVEALDVGEGYGPREVLSIYRLIQEAVSNAIRHAGASLLSLHARMEGEEVAIDITDDGIGISPDATPGRGLGNIQSRARELGGRARIVRGDVAGSAVRVRLPLTPHTAGPGVTP